MSCHGNSQDELFKPEIIHVGTGGTISSVEGQNGIAPAYRARKLSSLMREKHPELKGYDIRSITLMHKDSSNITYADRRRLAHYITDNLDKGYGKFLITHGTDTMEETAHFLAFMVLHPRRKIYLTGSTFPPHAEDTDAYDNFASTVVTTKKDLEGVFIVYDGDIMLGPRTAKINPYSKKAFTSKNFPVVGNVKLSRLNHHYAYNFDFGEDVLSKVKRLNEDLCFYIGTEPLYLFRPLKSRKVGHIELVADRGPKDLDIEFSIKRRGAVILEVYGSGGVPDKWLPHIEKWRRNGKQIIITSRCDQPLITLDYPMMKAAHEMGAIVAYDMLPRAAVAKAMVGVTYLSEEDDVFKKFMLANICGEIDPETVCRYERTYPSREEIRDIFSLIRQREMTYREAGKTAKEKNNAMTEDSEQPVSNQSKKWYRRVPQFAFRFPGATINGFGAGFEEFYKTLTSE